MDKKFARINEMEQIFERVAQTQSAFERAVDEYRQIREDVEKLEAYYGSRQWKQDFAMDERGEIPADIKRGVLSEDGLYNVLDRHKEIMEMLGDN